MFCPNCGAKTSIEQKFCRACGLGLDKIALSLTEQLPTSPDEHLMAEKTRYERMALAMLSVFGFGVLMLILYGVVYKMMIMRGKWMWGLAVIGFIIMGACGLLSVILFEKANEAKEAAGKRRLDAQDASTSVTPTRELLREGHLEPIPSVTDRTTDLLYAQKNDAPGR